MHPLQPIEATYPITFRAEEAKLLGSYLKQHTSVVLVGMKRVGISNFLRFFLYHPDVPATYIKNGSNLFVAIDLNDLVERTPGPFWMLTLKRLVDATETAQLPAAVQAKAQHIFAECIQLQDAFLTLEGVRKVAQLIASAGQTLTLFFIRFDRLQEALTSEFFGNLQGLKEAVGPTLCYVFTSHRPLPDLVPHVVTKPAQAVFAREVFVKPADQVDLAVIMQTLLQRYDLKLPADTQKALLKLCGGHVQYLQLAVLKLRNEVAALPSTMTELQSVLEQDDDLLGLSEEIVDSLRVDEKQALLEQVLPALGTAAANQLRFNTLPAYLIDTGLLQLSPPMPAHLFNDFFWSYLKGITHSASKPSLELTKKEHVLFELLQTHLGKLVERDDIIDHVWPEQAELGVSDWALDRLVARLRSKLKDQDSAFAITTIVSRGYKLVEV
jgi:hypothetical protein